MEQLLPRLRQFFPPTKNKFSPTHHTLCRCQRARGNVAVLSVMWCALTVVGGAAIARATHITVVAGNGQFIADAVALAYVDRGATRAEFLARTLGVSIEKIETSSNGIVTIEVHGQGFSATSSAS